MAATDGRAAARLALFEALARAPWSFDFFQALRRIEGVFADRPRLGQGAAAGGRAGAPVPGGLRGLRAVDAVGLRGAGRRAPAATRAALLRSARAQRSAAAAPDRVRARAAAPPRRRDASCASSTSSTTGWRCSSTARGPRRGRPCSTTGPTRTGSPSTWGRSPGYGSPGHARPRRRARPRQAVLRRTPGAEREERRGPRLDPGGLLRAAGARGAVRAGLARAAARPADRPGRRAAARAAMLGQRHRASASACATSRAGSAIVMGPMDLDRFSDFLPGGRSLDAARGLGAQLRRVRVRLGGPARAGARRGARHPPRPRRPARVDDVARRPARGHGRRRPDPGTGAHAAAASRRLAAA